MSPRRRSQRRAGRTLISHPSGTAHPILLPRSTKSTPVISDKSGQIHAKSGSQFLGVRNWQAGSLILLTILFFLLYLRTLCGTVPPGDSGELISAAWNLGVAHPPGYPTITILGHIASLLPVGTPAFRINLLSAILDSLALGVLGFGLLRLLQTGAAARDKIVHQLVAVTGTVVGVGLLAVSTAFWSYSLVAEVFALNNLFAVIILVLMLEWVRRPDRRWFLWISGLFSGLAMTNQHTIVLFAPGLIVLLIWGLVRWRRESHSALLHLRSKHKVSDPGWRIRDIGIAVGFFIVGLLPYIYLPVAAHTDPVINWGNPVNLSNFLRVILRSDYGTFSLASGLPSGDRLHQLIVLGSYFIQSFTLVGVLLAVLGIVWFARKRRIEGIGLGLAFLFSGPLFAIFANPPIDYLFFQNIFVRFYILPSIPFAIFVAAGVALLLEAAERLAARAMAKLMPIVVVAIGLMTALIMLVSLTFVRLPTLDMSENRVAEYYGRDILATLEHNALLIALSSDEQYGPIVYMQTVLGFRTDVTFIHVPMLTSRWYADQQRHLHPEVTIPFSEYSMSKPVLLVDLVNSNIGHRAIYGQGNPNEDLTKTFDQLYAGLAFQFLRKGEGPDSYALLRSESARFTSLHFPERTYPAISWERIIAKHYGILAFRLGVARQLDGAQPDADFVEKMYRIAIINAPDIEGTYKNLGILLWKNSGQPSEIIDLLQKYLQLAPNDLDAENIRTVIATLEKGQ